MLAFLSEEELDEYLLHHELKRRTPNTITDAEKLRAELRGTRLRGCAIDNEEFEEGLKCVGVPVRDHTGNVVAGLGIAGLVSRLRSARTEIVTKSVINAAAELSVVLGYRQAD